MNQARTFVLLSALGICVACSSTKSDVPTTPTTSIPAGTTATGPTVSKTVDAAGGTVASTDGALTVEVPAGALAAGVALTITPISGAPSGSVGPVFDIGPSGTQFAKPVTLTFKIPQGEADAVNLVVATAVVGGAWVPLVGSASVPSAGTVTGSTTHLSMYGCVSGGPGPSLTDAGDPGKDASVVDGSPPDAGPGPRPVSSACQTCVAGGATSPCKAEGTACFADATCKACVQTDRTAASCASNSPWLALDSCACGSSCAAVECKGDCN